MAFESVRKLADADFPTRWGQFRILGFEGVVADPEPCNDQIPAPAERVESAVALVMGDIQSAGAADRPHPLAVPYRRRLPLAALRLPAAA